MGDAAGVAVGAFEALSRERSVLKEEGGGGDAALGPGGVVGEMFAAHVRDEDVRGRVEEVTHLRALGRGPLDRVPREVVGEGEVDDVVVAEVAGAGLHLGRTDLCEGEESLLRAFAVLARLFAVAGGGEERGEVGGIERLPGRAVPVSGNARGVGRGRRGDRLVRFYEERLTVVEEPPGRRGELGVRDEHVRVLSCRVEISREVLRHSLALHRCGLHGRFGRPRGREEREKRATGRHGRDAPYS